MNEGKAGSGEAVSHWHVHALEECVHCVPDGYCTSEVQPCAQRDLSSSLFSTSFLSFLGFFFGGGVN